MAGGGDKVDLEVDGEVCVEPLACASSNDRSESGLLPGVDFCLRSDRRGGRS